jgi:hypothetical protein
MKLARIVQTIPLFCCMNLAQAWELGDVGYLYNGYNDVQGKKVFVHVEIDDIRGKKAKVIARYACEHNAFSGYKCVDNWFSDYNILQRGEAKWVSMDELLTTWKDKVF